MNQRPYKRDEWFKLFDAKRVPCLAIVSFQPSSILPGWSLSVVHTKPKKGKIANEGWMLSLPFDAPEQTFDWLRDVAETLTNYNLVFAKELYHRIETGVIFGRQTVIKDYGKTVLATEQLLRDEFLHQLDYFEQRHLHIQTQTKEMVLSGFIIPLEQQLEETKALFPSPYAPKLELDIT